MGEGIEARHAGVRCELVGRAGGRVAYVTIDNAARLNTLNSTVMASFVGTLDGLAADAGLRAVVVTGAGERAFVGGADIREMAALDAAGAERFITLVHETCHAVRRVPAPVIARIRGFALGAGLELAAACDLRVAAEDAVFGMPEVRIGIPSVVEAALLPHLIGWGRTRQMLLTGETIGAAEALEWGLVEAVAPPEELDAAVERLLAPILEGGPQAIRLQKELIRAWEDLPASEAIRRGISCFTSAWNSPEPTEMMGAFVAKLRARRDGK
jgi:enoyl-CoA hydratase